MILFLILSLELLPGMGLIMTKKHTPQYFIYSLNFKSHNFQTESHFKRVAPTYRGSTTLSFLVLQLRSMLRTL